MHRAAGPGFSLPDFLNVGIAPPAPRGAMALAPRAGFMPVATLHGYQWHPKAFTPLLLPAYVLPFTQAIPGLAVFPGQVFTPLIPNPYTPAAGG